MQFSFEFQAGLVNGNGNEFVSHIFYLHIIIQMHFLQGINRWVRSDICITIIVVLLAAAISLQAISPSTQNYE